MEIGVQRGLLEVMPVNIKREETGFLRARFQVSNLIGHLRGKGDRKEN